MLYPVDKLLSNRDKVVAANHKETVRDALHKMVQYDFSQLPIVDDDGNLLGLISEQSITRIYFHINDQATLMTVPVTHCLTRPLTLTTEADLFDALDLLQRNYAIVIVEGRKPIGILTNYDTTHFFRNITEGLLIIEDIETSLRQYIEAIFADKASMDAALFHAFGAHKQNTGQPARQYDELSFYQHIQLITAAPNWQHFARFFEPKPLFQQLMDQVRQVRNQLAHFRDEIDAIQHDALVRASAWLASRPKVGLIVPLKPLVLTASIPSPTVITSGDQGKYMPLAHWLNMQDPDRPVKLTFDEIEAILGTPLPPSARQHRSWWANDAVGHRQSRVWLEAGWRVEDVDFATSSATFRNSLGALYQVFFADLVEQLRSLRPGITRIKVSSELNYCNIASGRSGITFSWTFARQDGLRVELYIDTFDRAKNERAFSQLQTQQAQIEDEIGMPLSWAPLLGKRACRIFVARGVDITAPTEELAAAKTWAIDLMLKFLDAFQPRIREMILE